MEYSQRISQIANLTMDEIIANCRAHVPWNHRNRPYWHPELKHGVDLLHSDEGLDCYMAAYGEMHQSKCRAALQNIPLPQSNKGAPIEIIDWGCGQGIGSMCVIDFLKDREMIGYLKRVTLIEPSAEALERAHANVKHATGGGVRIVPINRYLPAVRSADEIDNVDIQYDYVFHVFSNILDVQNIDLAKLARCLAVPAHTHYVLCTGPLNANAFRIDRFCEFFQPQAYFSNITDRSYNHTSDTGYLYTCKTKAFVYDGGPLNLSGYNPDEKASGPIYREYDEDLHITDGAMSDDKRQVYSQLLKLVSENSTDLLYPDPNINGIAPDFIIVRPNVGMIVFSLFDEDLSQCTIDKVDSSAKATVVIVGKSTPQQKELASPLLVLDDYQDQLIENFSELTKAVIQSCCNLKVVKKVLICTGGTTAQAHALFDNRQYITVIGREFLSETMDSNRFYGNLGFNRPNAVFDSVVLSQLKRDLSPRWHSYREGEKVYLTPQQSALAKSEEGAQRKISGVAGSGKTQVMATRAVNAQLRTGGRVLLLTFNITLSNYLRMRIGQVRADFPWENIHIDYYTRLFQKHAHATGLPIHYDSEGHSDDFDNPDFFRDVADQLPKYDAIFIDEVQDYKTEWLKLLQNYFLRAGGEFVVFGDPKQNIYNRPQDKEGNVRIGVIPGVWKTSLTKGMRFNIPALASLATTFQQRYLEHSESIEASDKAVPQNQGDLFKHIFYERIAGTDTESIVLSAYHTCMDFIKNNCPEEGKVAIIAPQIEILQRIDSLYRAETHNDTTVSFVRLEDEHSIADERDVRRLQKVMKRSFTMDTHYLKLSTIQSFKGWEADTLICIINNGDGTTASLPQLVYTGITRAKENLLVINIGSQQYHDFFEAAAR